MKKIFFLLLLVTTLAQAGLPPTTSKVSGDSVNLTSFNYQFPNFTATRTGTTISLGVNSIAGGGSGQVTANDALNAFLPSQGGHSGQVLSTDGSNTSWSASGGSGTVTSVSLTVPSFLSVAGSPVTNSGTLAVTFSGTAIPIANGGTAGTTAASAFNNLNPMTTLGDLIIESGASTASRLAGNITTNTQVLTQTGTGSVSAAPAWQALSSIGISTDWAPSVVTPTNLGSITNLAFFQRRVGDTACFQGTFTDGTGNGSSASIVLPSGMVIDSTKISTVSQMNVVGTYFYGSSGTSALYASDIGAVLFYDGSTTDRVFIGFRHQSGGAIAKIAGSSVSSGLPNFAQFCVPISGWSSSTIGVGQGSVLAAYGLTSQYTPTGSTAVKYDTKISDSPTPNYSTSTGLFTSPVTGTISVKACGQITTGSTDFYIVKNGVAGTPGGYLFDVTSGTTSGQCGSMDIPVNAGDTLGVYQNSSHAFSAASTNGYLNWATFTLASGNGAINNINARYFSSSTTVSGSLATINYSTKDYDSNNAYSSGTFTVPTNGAGKYQVNAGLLISGTVALNNQIVMEIQKNGTVVARKTINLSATLAQEAISVSDMINATDADTIRIQVSTSITGPSIVSSNFDNYVSIARVSN